MISIADDGSSVTELQTHWKEEYSIDLGPLPLVPNAVPFWNVFESSAKCSYQKIDPSNWLNP